MMSIFIIQNRNRILKWKFTRRIGNMAVTIVSANSLQHINKI